MTFDFFFNYFYCDIIKFRCQYFQLQEEVQKYLETVFLMRTL